MNVELYLRSNKDNKVAWKLVELSNQIDYTLNKQFIDLEDLTSITTDYTKTVSVPMTPANNELFNYIYKIQHIVGGDFFDASKKVDMQLVWNNNILLEGYAILKDVDTKNKTFNLVIYSETNRFLRQLLNTTIEKIELELLDSGRNRLMENIKITPYYVNRSFTTTMSVNGYKEGIANLFTDVIGFTPQVVCNGNLLKTDSVWDKNTKSNLNMSDYVSNAHSNDEDYKSEYITPLLKDGISFPQYPEINCNLTKGYFYVQSMFRIIKEYLESDQIGYAFNYNEVENADARFKQLCYFYPNGFNDKNGGDKNENLSIDDTQLTPSSIDLDKLGGSTFTNKVPYNILQTIPLMSNTDVSIESIPSRGYGAHDCIEITNKTEYNTKFKYYSKVSNSFSIYPETANIGDVKFYNLPNLPYIYLFKEDLMNGTSVASTTYYADVIIPPFTCAVGLKTEVEKKVIKYLKETYPDIMDENIEVKYIDDKSLHKKEKVVKDGDDVYTYNIGIEISHNFNLSANEKTRIYTTFIPVDVSDRTFDTTHALIYPYEYRSGWSTPWYEPEKQRHFGTYGATSTQTVGIIFNIVSFDTSSKTKYTAVWNGLPDIIGNDFKPFEWLLNFCKKYRYYIEFDELNKNITIYSKYFKPENGLKIVKKEIDYKQSVLVTPIVNDYKKIKFGYKTDKVNDRAKTYEETYGVAYGDKKIDTLFDVSEKELVLSKGKEIVPILVQQEVLSFIDIFNWNTRSSLPIRTNFNVNMIDDTSENKICNNEFYLYRTGYSITPYTFALTIYNSSMIGSNILCYYPYRQQDVDAQDILLGNYMGNRNTVPLFNYMGSYFNEPSIIYVQDYVSYPGIYNKRWENYLNEIFDVNNKKITCYVPLTVAEYYNFRFNQLWNIEGSLFIVNKIIDFNPTNNEPTKVELIQVNDIENYN